MNEVGNRSSRCPVRLAITRRRTGSLALKQSRPRQADSRGRTFAERVMSVLYVKDQDGSLWSILAWQGDEPSVEMGAEILRGRHRLAATPFSDDPNARDFPC